MLRAVQKKCACSNQLVKSLDAVRAAGKAVDLALPAELVQYADAGRSPDAFTTELHGRVARSSAAARAKQQAWDQLEAAIRHQGAELLTDAVKDDKG